MHTKKRRLDKVNLNRIAAINRILDRIEKRVDEEIATQKKGDYLCPTTTIMPKQSG